MGLHGLLVTLHFFADKARKLGGWQFCEPLLFNNIIDLSMLASEVVEQVSLPGEHLAAGAAQLALEVLHTPRELRRQVFHEVSAVVLLQIVAGLQALATHLTLPPPGVPRPHSPSIKDRRGWWHWMGVVITAQNKSLDVTFRINKGGLLYIFTVTVRDNKMFNFATRYSGQYVAPAMDITFSSEVTGFYSHCPQPVLSLLS